MNTPGHDLRILRWNEVGELFFRSEPLLVFVMDTFDDDWWTVPGDVLAMLETLQSSAAGPVLTYAVDFRVDPDFLRVLGTPPGPAIARRFPHVHRFEALLPGFRFGELIEFCRAAYGEIALEADSAA